MKKIILVIVFLANVLFNAQVAIGKNNVSSNSIILEFGTDPKGIVLPIATIDVNEVYTNGTILMDKSDFKIKVYQDGTWLELSDVGSVNEQLSGTTPITTTRALIASSNEEVGAGVVMGNKTTAQNNNVRGVLVLEDSAKALVLPMVENPHLNIKKPTAGTMCYDTASDSLAVFDGKVWNYWK